MRSNYRRRRWWLHVVLVPVALIVPSVFTLLYFWNIFPVDFPTRWAISDTVVVNRRNNLPMRIRTKNWTNVRTAYFTVISSSEYMIGAQILVCRLRHYSPHIPMYVLVDESMRRSHEHVMSYFTQILNATVVFVPDLAYETGLAHEVRSKTYTKLNLWQFTNVQVGLYLDADTLPIQSPEDLLYVLSDDVDDALQPRQHLYEFAVVGNEDYFNTGVFVFRPSTRTFQDIMLRLQYQNYSKDVNNPTEQDLLVSHFGQYQNKTLFLDGTYNYRPMHHQNGFTASSQPVILHWIGNPKPWTYILGKNTSIEGLFTTTSDKARTTLPTWSIHLYQQEIERYFSVCHDLHASFE
jgi:alpha-N-acetylglucosamine transferase